MPPWEHVFWHCLIPTLIPQTVLALGVLTVLLKGPWKVSQPRRAAGERQGSTTSNGYPYHAGGHIVTKAKVNSDTLHLAQIGFWIVRNLEFFLFPIFPTMHGAKATVIDSLMHRGHCHDSLAAKRLNCHLQLAFSTALVALTCLLQSATGWQRLWCQG